MSIENPNGNIAKKVKEVQSFEFNGSNADNTLRSDETSVGVNKNIVPTIWDKDIAYCEHDVVLVTVNDTIRLYKALNAVKSAVPPYEDKDNWKENTYQFFASFAKKASEDENGHKIHETYVTKEKGKGLSTNDFTNEAKATLHTHANRSVLDKVTDDALDAVSENSTARHSHKNKSALDSITAAKIQLWDNKSDFDGSYNSLKDKPAIPSTAGLASEQYVDNALKGIDLSGYVKKEDGKGLSSNDFSNEDKEAIHNHDNKEVLDKIKYEMLHEGIHHVECASEEEVAKLVDNYDYKVFYVELTTTEGTTSRSIPTLPPAAGLVGGTTTTTTRFYIFQDVSTSISNNSVPDFSLMGNSLYTQIKLSQDGLFKRTVTVTVSEPPVYSYTEWESLHHTKAEIAENYAPITLINDMQAQIAKMIKPEYITNASYMFAEGVNSSLLRVLNTEYIEVANSTFKKNPNENISFDAINCKRMEHCFENSLAVTIIFPNGTPKLIYADNICSKCESLTGINGLDCSNVITLKYGFNGCAFLKVVDLVSTANVKDFSYSFYGSGIKTITGLDTSSAEHLDGAWAKSSIEVLVLDCTNVKSAVGVFTDCLSLSALTLKNLTDSGVALEMFNSLPTTEAGTITVENCTISDDIKAIATEKGWLINEQ